MRALDLAPAGEREEFLDIGWYLLDLSAQAPNAWTLLLAHGSESFAELADDHAEALSAGGHDTLYFWCSDTVMCSAISAYHNGACRWSVEYDCEEDGGPKIHGDPPQLVHTLDRKVRDDQRVEDAKEAAEPTSFGAADVLYGLTAKIGEALTSFNHSPWPQPDEDPFEGMYQPLDKA